MSTRESMLFKDHLKIGKNHKENSIFTKGKRVISIIVSKQIEIIVLFSFSEIADRRSLLNKLFQRMNT
jgi:hypothetical protein